MQAPLSALGGWGEHLELDLAATAALTEAAACDGWVDCNGELDSGAATAPLLSLGGGQAPPEPEAGQRQEAMDALQGLEGFGGLLGDDLYDSLLRDSSGATVETRVQEVVSCGFGWDVCNNAATAAAETAVAAAASAAAGVPDMLFVKGEGGCDEEAAARGGRDSVGSGSSRGLFEGWLGSMHGGGRAQESRCSSPFAVVESADVAVGATWEAGSWPSLEGMGLGESVDDAIVQSTSDAGASVDVRVEEVLAATPSSGSQDSGDGDCDCAEEPTDAAAADAEADVGGAGVNAMHCGTASGAVTRQRHGAGLVRAD